MPRSRFLPAAIAVAAILHSPGAAIAQSYPSRPITLTVPFPPGGPTDTIARIVADGLGPALGQSVIVKNVPGATGSIASGQVARAVPDGYTVILGTTATHVFNGAVYDLDHKVIEDFAAVALIASDPQIVVVRKSLPVASMAQLVYWLKANPGKATAGTAGVGSTAHISAVRFQTMTKTQFGFVPYRGLGPAMQDLLAGRIDMLFDLAANSLPRIQSAEIKGLAVTSHLRLTGVPDIPTMAEAGLPGFVFANWHGLWTPRATPPQVIQKLNAAIVRALSDPATIKRLVAIGQQLPAEDNQNPDALAKLQREEAAVWWPIIKAANIKAD